VIAVTTGRAIYVLDPGSQLRGDDLFVHDIAPDAMYLAARGLEAAAGAAVVATHTALVGCTSVGFEAFGAGTTMSVTDSLVRDTRRDAMVMHGDGALTNAGASLTLARIVLESSGESGVYVYADHSTCDVTDAVVRDTRAGTPQPANGLDAFHGSTITAHRVRVSDLVGTAFIADSASMTVEDSVATRIGVPGIASAGTQAQFGGDMSIARTRIDGVDGVGCTVVMGGTVSVNGSIVRGVRVGDPMTAVGGIVVLGGAIRASGVLLEDNLGFGAIAGGAGSMLALSDAVVRNPPSIAADGLRGGIGCDGPSSATVDRVVVEGCRGVGVASQDRCQVTLRDAVVRDTLALPSGMGGYGLLAEGASPMPSPTSLTAQRVLMDGNTYASAYAYRPMTSLTLDACVLRGTRQHDATVLAPGVAVTVGATGTVTRSIVASNVGDGIWTSNNATVLVEDSAIRGNRTLPDGAGGSAVIAYLGSTIAMRRVAVEHHTTIGIQISDRNTAAQFEDVIVRDVASSTGVGLGVGVLVGGSTFDATRLSIADVGGVGLEVVNADLDRAAPATGNLADVFVRNVRASNVEITLDMMHPVGPTVAYGVHVAGTGSLAATRIVVDASGYGFFDASARSLSIDTGVFAHQLDALGATAHVDPSSIQLQNVFAVDDARGDVVEMDGLPAGTALAPPSPVCPPAGCM
jgi:hypothetical protein